MNSELIAAFDYYEREKGIKREILTEAVTNALRSAYIKRFGQPHDLRIDLNAKGGDIRVFVTCKVVERVIDDNLETTLAKARLTKPDAKLDDMVEVEVPPNSFGRIAAQTARQAISSACARRRRRCSSTSSRIAPAKSSPAPCAASSARM